MVGVSNDTQRLSVTSYVSKFHIVIREYNNNHVIMKDFTEVGSVHRPTMKL